MARWKTGRRFGPLGVWPTSGQRSAWQLSRNARAALDGWATAKKLPAASAGPTAPIANPSGAADPSSGPPAAGSEAD
eukprot:13439330-Alexandrium_andersonii.AAC.1